MYVCHCRAVTDRRIREVIEAGARTPRQVALACGAGSTCGGCLSTIRELLVAHGGRPCVCPCPLVAGWLAGGGETDAGRGAAQPQPA